MKSESRVPKGYKKGTKDWEAEYDMLLDDGVTCSKCAHVERCATMFGQKRDATSCQFYPNRFLERVSGPTTPEEFLANRPIGPEDLS